MDIEIFIKYWKIMHTFKFVTCLDKTLEKVQLPGMITYTFIEQRN